MKEYKEITEGVWSPIKVGLLEELIKLIIGATIVGGILGAIFAYLIIKFNI